jgi:hypothetical protein
VRRVSGAAVGMEVFRETSGGAVAVRQIGDVQARGVLRCSRTREPTTTTLTCRSASLTALSHVRLPKPDRRRVLTFCTLPMPACERLP